MSNFTPPAVRRAMSSALSVFSVFSVFSVKSAQSGGSHE